MDEDIFTIHSRSIHVHALHLPRERTGTFHCMSHSMVRERKERMGIHMTHIIDLMVYFPFVIVGLGQVLILGTSPAGASRTAAKTRAWGVTHGRFAETRYTPAHRTEKKALVHLPQVPRHPVASLPRI